MMPTESFQSCRRAFSSPGGWPEFEAEGVCGLTGRVVFGGVTPRRSGGETRDFFEREPQDAIGVMCFHGIDPSGWESQFKQARGSPLCVTPLPETRSPNRRR